MRRPLVGSALKSLPAGRSSRYFSLAAAFENLADGSHEGSETERNEGGSNEPNNRSRQAKRERVASAMMMIALWAILSLFAYFAF